MDFPALMALMDRTLIDALAVPTTYQPEFGTPVAVDGIFDAAYVHVEAGQAGVSSAGPCVFYRLADLPVDPDDDDPTITVAAVTYRVREVMKDGQGGVRLLLHRRADV